MTLSNGTTRFHCPKCGYVLNDNINLYCTELRKQNFGISPILPTCLLCGSEITVNRSDIYTSNNASKVIVLTGTCASGKSSTAEVLMEKYGFDVIDGDCVIQVVKHKLGVNKIEYNSPSMYKEIAAELDILIALKKDIVISHVITSEDIDVYRKIFKERNINYKIFLLKPQYSDAIERSKTRTCHTSITPEKWVRYFYDILNTFENQDNSDLLIFNNSNYSVEKSARKILQMSI